VLKTPAGNPIAALYSKKLKGAANHQQGTEVCQQPLE
jgi:hypothetical protein